MLRRCALWLLPDADDTERLTSVFGRIARRLGRRTFTPHVTLCGGLEASPRRLAAALDRLAPELSPIELPVDGVRATASTFRALVLLLRPTTDLLRLRRRILEILPSTPRLPTPHLSLTYGALPIPVADALADVALPDHLRFDAAALAAPGAAGWEDTANWALLHRATLGDGPRGAANRPRS